MHSGLPPSLQAVAELAAAEVALRSLRTAPARAALDRAQEAAERARVPALLAEVAEARAALDRPAARRFHAGDELPLRLDKIEALLASGALVLDACRRGLRARRRVACRWRVGRCSSRWRARSPKAGPATWTATR